MTMVDSTKCLKTLPILFYLCLCLWNSHAMVYTHPPSLTENDFSSSKGSPSSTLDESGLTGDKNGGVIGMEDDLFSSSMNHPGGELDRRRGAGAKIYKVGDETSRSNGKTRSSGGETKISGHEKIPSFMDSLRRDILMKLKTSTHRINYTGGQMGRGSSNILEGGRNKVIPLKSNYSSIDLSAVDNRNANVRQEWQRTETESEVKLRLNRIQEMSTSYPLLSVEKHKVKHLVIGFVVVALTILLLIILLVMCKLIDIETLQTTRSYRHQDALTVENRSSRSHPRETVHSCLLSQNGIQFVASPGVRPIQTRPRRTSVSIPGNAQGISASDRNPRNHGVRSTRCPASTSTFTATANNSLRPGTASVATTPSSLGPPPNYFATIEMPPSYEEVIRLDRSAGASRKSVDSYTRNLANCDSI